MAADFGRQSIESIEDPVARLRVLMKRLLDPGGCPWDREQTHATLKQYMIEQAYEACEAIDDGDDLELCEELGDVGLQVVFHAELAERRGAFNLDDVYASICKKLLDRHPHVFGTVDAADSDAVLKNWEQIKKEEKATKAAERGTERKSILDGVPKAMPSLQRAGRLQEKASRVGFDWPSSEPVLEKVREEFEELAEAASQKDRAHIEEEMGDLLFSLVNVSRFLDIQPEECLRWACEKFTARFEWIENYTEAQGRDLSSMSLQEMDQLWDEAKTQ